MPTRSQFIDLTRGVLGRFVSRYNDIDGRWGIGVLVESLHDSDESETTYDVGSSSEPFIHRQAEWLRSRLAQERIPRSWMKSCALRIRVVRNGTPPVDSHTREAWAAGVAVHSATVVVEITDDRGQVWSACDIAWAWDASVHQSPVTS